MNLDKHLSRFICKTATFLGRREYIAKYHVHNKILSSIFAELEIIDRPPLIHSLPSPLDGSNDTRTRLWIGPPSFSSGWLGNLITVHCGSGGGVFIPLRCCLGRALATILDPGNQNLMPWNYVTSLSGDTTKQALLACFNFVHVFLYTNRSMLSLVTSVCRVLMFFWNISLGLGLVC